LTGRGRTAETRSVVVAEEEEEEEAVEVWEVATRRARCTA
jgi:hypothetical protein